MSDRKTAVALTSQSHLTKVELTSEEVKNDHVIIEGNFVTPLVKFLPGLLPKETEKAHFQVLVFCTKLLNPTSSRESSIAKLFSNLIISP